MNDVNCDLHNSVSNCCYQKHWPWMEGACFSLPQADNTFQLERAVVKASGCRMLALGSMAPDACSFALDNALIQT